MGKVMKAKKESVKKVSGKVEQPPRMTPDEPEMISDEPRRAEMSPDDFK